MDGLCTTELPAEGAVTELGAGILVSLWDVVGEGVWVWRESKAVRVGGNTRGVGRHRSFRYVSF